MRIRDVSPSDVPRLHELYLEQGFDYAEPEWAKMIGKVLVDDQDVVQAYELARKTCETYAGMAQGTWATPGMKATHFRHLDSAMVELLRQEGYEDQHSWVAPTLRAFIRRMQKELGWVRTDGKDSFVALVRWFGARS